ncbi:MAG: chorismate mutase [Actinomycetota bacterium]
MKIVRALRGATTLDQDTREQVIERTRTLLSEMISRNGAEIDDLISIVFTATPDIRSEFPAAAAREMGITYIPLLGAQELDVSNSIHLCIRVLIHFYTERQLMGLRHVYLERARPLSYDLPE